MLRLFFCLKRENVTKKYSKVVYKYSIIYVDTKAGRGANCASAFFVLTQKKRTQEGE